MSYDDDVDEELKELEMYLEKTCSRIVSWGYFDDDQKEASGNEFEDALSTRDELIERRTNLMRGQ